MNDLKDALDFLIRQGRDAKTFTLAPDYEHTGHYFVHNGDGIVEDRWKVQKPDTQEFDSLQSFCDSIRDFANRATVFYSHMGARVSVPMEVEDAVVMRQFQVGDSAHPMFNSLVSLLNGRPMDQQTIVRTFRYELPNVVPAPFLDELERLHISRNDQTGVTVGRGREGVDRSLQEQITGAAGDLPETVKLKVPVIYLPEFYETPFYLDALLEVVTGESRPVFKLWPTPNSVELVIAAAADAIAGFLRSNLPNDTHLAYGRSVPSR